MLILASRGKFTAGEVRIAYLGIARWGRAVLDEARQAKLGLFRCGVVRHVLVHQGTAISINIQ